MKQKLLSGFVIIMGLLTITGCMKTNTSNNSVKENDNTPSIKVDETTNTFNVDDVTFTFNNNAEFHDFNYKTDEKMSVSDLAQSRLLQYENKDIYNGTYVFKVEMSYEMNKRLDDVSTQYGNKRYESKTINGFSWVIYKSENNVVYLTEKNYNLYKINFDKDEDCDVDINIFSQVFMNGVTLK